MNHNVLARQGHQDVFQRAVPRQGPPRRGVGAPEKVEALLNIQVAERHLA